MALHRPEHKSKSAALISKNEKLKTKIDHLYSLLEWTKDILDNENNIDDEWREVDKEKLVAAIDAELKKHVKLKKNKEK
jgi:hypothetical protein